MIVLAAADTIAGIASSASKVTCTIHGMELNAGTEVYKILYQGQLAASTTTIYTVPSSTQAFIKSINIVNTDTVARTFKLYRGGTADANAMTPVFTLAPGCAANYEDRLGWQFVDTKGSLLTTPYKYVSPWPYLGIAGTLADTHRVWVEESTSNALTSGRAFVQAIYLRAGTVVSSIGCYAQGSWTLGYFIVGLFTAQNELIAQSTNTGTSPSGDFVTALESSVRITKSGLYKVGFCCNGTPGTLKGTTLSGSTMTSGFNEFAGAMISGQFPAAPNLVTDRFFPHPTAVLTASTVRTWAYVK